MYNNPLFIRYSLDHPITANEVKRLPEFRFKREMRLATFLGGIEYVFTLPFLFLPFIHLIWRIPTVLASATMISREVENQTWHPLRSLPISIREIVWAKYAAIFPYMEPQLNLLFYLRGGPAIIILGVWAASTITSLPQRGLEQWLADTLAIVLSVIYVVISPTLDVAVDGALGLLASALSPRRSTALILATLVRTTLWLLPLLPLVMLQYGVLPTFGLVGLQPENIDLRAWAVVANFGPGYAYLWNLGPWISIVLVLGTVALRLGFIRLALELAAYRAERLEV